MSTDLADHGRLAPGLYDRLISGALKQSLGDAKGPVFADLKDLDPGDSHAAAAQYLESLIATALATHRGEGGMEQQRRIANRLIALLAEELGTEWGAQMSLVDPLQRLLAVHRQAPSGTTLRPDTPLARSTLLTGTRSDPSLASQLQKEIGNADRVDILCSFIKWSGLRLLLPALEEFTRAPNSDSPRLRVITTSYMGVTDPRAVDALRALPNTEVRVSYDTARTRLHAKSYLIHRETGFGSAYVGSANISHAALSEGLEWTSKISQYELPHLWQRIQGTFESYWHDEEFEPLTLAMMPRLQEAIERERRSSSGDDRALQFFDLRPFPFQEEILDVLAAERDVQGKRKHLVVAATGTGKTMIAAFDYRRWRQSSGGASSLLFVAHREEILRQARDTFRNVLRDQNFGDLLVAGANPAQRAHLFCSIQSYRSKGLASLPRDAFQYVVVDEFHRAAAPSYQQLLNHVQPTVLLGLTATPERSDALDVLHWFGGESSAEIRLPDAINRRLLCPFHYFGIADSVDLDSLRWQRGGYSTDDLDRVYTGNDVRAGLVLQKLVDTVLAPSQMRALGFCASVAHARFMARFMSDRGVPSIALSAESSDEERHSAKSKLTRREINMIFVVDLYNEGIDIPEVDTVLFLRPTESLTVFLQQLGRGLRQHPEKDCLTVLDFIGQQRREFRFAPRFRAFSSEPAHPVDTEVEAGCPHLPPGCSVQLERIAQQRILENLRATAAVRRPRMIADLRELGRLLGREPTIHEVLQHLDIELDQLLDRGLWSRLLCDAGLKPSFADPDEEQLAKGLHRLAHIDDPALIRRLLQDLEASAPPTPQDELDPIRLEMLHVTLWGKGGLDQSLVDADRRLRRNPNGRRDLCLVLRERLAHTHTLLHPIDSSVSGPLGLHASYTQHEALIGLGHWTLSRQPLHRAGVLQLTHCKCDAFFITLNKTEDAYSPTTMYEDYAISDQLFHWQSQSTTSSRSPTGQRYIHHREMGYTPLLFVRENRKLGSGLSAPYAFLGPADYVSHRGDRPMSVVWRLRTPMPARLLRTTARQAVG